MKLFKFILLFLFLFVCFIPLYAVQRTVLIEGGTRTTP